jgi:hypothetical protein
VGTLLNPTTPLVGFSSSSALLFQDRLTGSATTRGASPAIGVDRSAAVVIGRISGGVVVIASGPIWTTVGVIDRIGVGVGGMELVINLGADVGIVEKDRVVGLDEYVIVDEELVRFEAGVVVGLVNCPKSLGSSAIIAKYRK